MTTVTTTTATPLERLPPEVLDIILEPLPVKYRINLWKTSHRLACTLHDRFLGTPEARNDMITRGCRRGDTRMIRAAVLAGANPSYYYVQEYAVEKPQEAKWLFGRPFLTEDKISTLGEAARRHKPRVIHLLLEMGARIEETDNEDRISMLKCLTRPLDLHLAQRLVEGGFDADSLGTPGFSSVLVNHVQDGAPIELVETLLDYGADPNFVVNSASALTATPLSAAVESGSEALAELLLRYGGNVADREPMLRPVRYQTIEDSRRYPVMCAAARHMGRTGSTAMVDWCIRHGADMNAILLYEHGSQQILLLSRPPSSTLRR